MDLEPSADINLRSPQRALIELRMAHADLDSLIDRAAEQAPVDDLALRRLKKRRLLLRDQIARLEEELGTRLFERRPRQDLRDRAHQKYKSISPAQTRCFDLGRS
jgi:hypothetical protein